MDFRIPYFLTNKEWYRYATADEERATGRGYVLTDKAPAKARQSYEDFYAEDTDSDGRVADY